MVTNGSILALDVGEARIGVALARSDVKLATPQGAIEQSETSLAAIYDLCKRENVTQVVVGLPRGLDGQETAQTAYVRIFIQKLAAFIKLPVDVTDEALTSKKAEAELEARKKPYTKGDIDALAATYILEDYLAALPGSTITEVEGVN